MHEIYLVYERTNAKGRPLRLWHSDGLPSPLDENLGFDARLSWRQIDGIAAGHRWIYELEHRHDRIQYTDGDQLEPLLRRQHLMDGVARGDGYLLVNLSFEAQIPDYVTRIRSHIEDLGIGSDRVIWATGSHDAAAQVDRYALGMRPMIMRASESMSAFWLRDRVSPLPTRQVQKRFICFMRRFRPHRFQLLAHLQDRGLLQHAYVSFGRHVEGMDALETAVAQCDSLPDGDRVINSIREIYDRLPFVVDQVDANINLCETQLADATLHHHMTSGISIVAETMFHASYRFLSEKTYHPIRYLQPFIMVGPAGNLAALRADGYETFGDFWDESYDTIADNHLRMMAVMDLVQDVAGWSAERFDRFMRDSAGVCAHNLRLLQACHQRRDHTADLSSLWS